MFIRLRVYRKYVLWIITLWIFLTTSFYFFWNFEASFADHIQRSRMKSLINNDISKIIKSRKHDLETFVIIAGSPMERSYGKKDWENYKQNLKESQRVGPGEQGSAVILSGEQKKLSNKTKTLNGFNIYVSEMISVNRSVKDLRDIGCKGRKYLSSLPPVSIIIPIFEEHWKTLMRTIHSTINRAPLELIKEIIFVDDGSSRLYLKEQLDHYIRTHFPSGFIKILHFKNRQGLIRARIEGAKVATADILLFLDSHCEVGINWLPPLLEPIAMDYKTVTCPLIDIVHDETSEYVLQDNGARGVFDWEFGYQRIPKLPEDQIRPTQPFPSPVMAGGLFAISRRWFWELGGYDSGLEIWGGEQYELSFKIWMCGGKLLDIPCSRIGHIYRGAPTSFPEPNLGNFLGRNFKRVIEVWMDQYKEYVYLRHPEYHKLDTGDLSEQYAIRRRLQCKSFKWYLEQIAPDLTQNYPVIEPLPSAIGRIHSSIQPDLCIDSEGKQAKLRRCVDQNIASDSSQMFEFTFHEDIRLVKSSQCLDVPKAGPQEPIMVFSCHGQRGNQQFEIRHAGVAKANPIILRHVTSNFCIDLDDHNWSLYVNPCNASSKSQQWLWDTLQIDKAAESRRKVGLK